MPNCPAMGEENPLTMRARTLQLLVVACGLLLVLTGVARNGLGWVEAQEATPPAHQHGSTHDTAGQSERSPYADGIDLTALIRSLTPIQVAEIERGEGAGFALPAELNGVPGPRHVLDFAHELGLSHQQVEAVRAVGDQMRAAVLPAGRRYLDALQALEEGFRAGTITEAALPERVAEVKRLEGELVAAHLVAHLRTADLLTPEQIVAYNRLRGYE